MMNLRIMNLMEDVFVFGGIENEKQNNNHIWNNCTNYGYSTLLEDVVKKCKNTQKK